MKDREQAESAKLQKTIGIYLLAAFGFSWLIWLPLLANRQWGQSLPVLPQQYYLGSFGPLAGSVAAALMTGGLRGVKAWARRTFSLGFPVKWLIIAVALPAAYGAAAILAHYFVTGGWPEWSGFGITEKLPGFNVFQTAGVWMLTFGIGEESGWRGYLLPELNKRFSILKASLIVAGVWMLWHLPAFGFNPNYMEMGVGIIGWAIALAYGSVLLAWICRGSNWSILPVVLWHGGFDLLTASDQAGTVMAAVCSMLVIVHGILLSRKLGREKAEGSDG